MEEMTAGVKRWLIESTAASTIGYTGALTPIRSE